VQDGPLSLEILGVATKGLFMLREMELRETHRLILGSKVPRQCSELDCPLSGAAGPEVLEAQQEVVDRIVDSASSGTNLLQVLSLREVWGGDCLRFCKSCVEGWEAGHANVRKKTWAVLPDAFRLSS